MDPAIKLLTHKILCNETEILLYHENYPKESKIPNTWQNNNILNHQYLIKSYTKALKVLKEHQETKDNS
jgi:hypothetical protein